MSRNPFLTLVLFLLCAAGAAWLVLDTEDVGPPQEKVFGEFMKTRDLLGFDRRVGGTKDLQIEQTIKEGGRFWQMRHPLETPAVFVSINSIIHALVYMRTDSKFDPADAGFDPADFGLDRPEVELDLRSEKGTVTLRIGKKEDFGTRWFFSVVRDGVVDGYYLMSKAEHEAFTAPWQDFENKRISRGTFAPNTVARVEVRTKVIIVKGATGQTETRVDKAVIRAPRSRGDAYALLEPEDLFGESIERRAMDRLFHEIQNLTALEKFGFVAGEESKWGFDEPELVVTFTFKENANEPKRSYVFGKVTRQVTPETTEDDYYAWAAGSERLGRIDVKSFQNIPRSLDGPEGFRARTLYQREWFAALKGLRIEDRELGKVLVVERRGQGFTVVEPKGLRYAEAGLTNFIQTLYVKGTIDAFFDRNPKNMSQYFKGGEPTVVLTVTVDSGDGTSFERSFKFGRPKDGSSAAYAQHDRNPQIYKIDGRYLENLQRMWLHFIDPTHFEIPEDRLDGWIVEGIRVPEKPRFKYACKRDAASGDWKWDFGRGGIQTESLRLAEADELGGILNNMSVIGYRTWDPARRSTYNMGDDEFFIRVKILYRDDDGNPQTRILRVSRGSWGGLDEKTFAMFEGDDIIFGYSNRLYNLLKGGLRKP